MGEPRGVLGNGPSRQRFQNCTGSRVERQSISTSIHHGIILDAIGRVFVCFFFCSFGAKFFLCFIFPDDDLDRHTRSMSALCRMLPVWGESVNAVQQLRAVVRNANFGSRFIFYSTSTVSSPPPSSTVPLQRGRIHWCSRIYRFRYIPFFTKPSFVFVQTLPIFPSGFVLVFWGEARQRYVVGWRMNTNEEVGK